MGVLKAASMAFLIGLGGAVAAAPGVSQAQVGIGISVNVAPPPLPVYAQPPLPGYGFIWTPGYWAWNAAINDYFWVPGTWVRPPRVGVLWTPGYWGWSGGAYVFNAGYWGPHVGFYGGINYGFGYGGFGFGGGEWRGGQLYYNSSVTNVSNTNITNVYNRTVVNTTTTRASFNGGTGGVQAQPRPQELAAASETHIPATAGQERQVQMSRAEPSLRASVNHGAPAIAATVHPGALHGPGAIPAAHAKPMGMGRPPGPAGAGRPPGPQGGGPKHNQPRPEGRPPAQP